MKHARFPTSPLSRRTFLKAAASLGAATLLPGERGKASGTLPTSDAIRAPDAAWPDATIRVDADADQGPVSHAWAFFGHDEANWAATDRGQALLAELNALSPVPVHLRAHHLLTSLAEGGLPEADLKWSATNVYREDEQGRPVYNWTATDRLFDAYAAHDVTPFVEVGLMPQTLATRGIGKAILNGFRMLGMMTGRRLHTESTGAVGLEEVLEAGVREASDIDAMAVRNGDVLTVLVWNYHDDDMPVPPTTVRVRVQTFRRKRRQCFWSITASTGGTAIRIRCGRRWAGRRIRPKGSFDGSVKRARWPWRSRLGGSIKQKERILRWGWRCRATASRCSS